MMSPIFLALSLVVFLKTPQYSNSYTHNYIRKRQYRIYTHASSSSSSSSSEFSALDDSDFTQNTLTPFERLSRSAKFWSNAVPIIFSYYKTYASISLSSQITGVCLSDEECSLEYQENHDRGAERLRSMVDELKGFYVKTGQIIASRQDLFPRAYTEKLSGLTDYLDPMGIEIVERVVLEQLVRGNGLGERLEDVFVEFDEKPLGAASIAQVHRARLHEKFGGGEVAVKVQRPSIEPKLLGDIKNLKLLR